ncbi:DUF6318 family protein [Arthrobacter sp. efr-133-TYG-104]|uniref:DUF6318 family protein n=1 Tax=Arthrobacter sp. efr-133-TYG-104 TaxID=3040324 RepID=UPI00255169CD|nr:DUF6318 family protein [Arthrobacter sp. efr-133-TYG-104]
MFRVSLATFPSPRARTLAFGLALALLLGGCQGGGPPSTSSPTTESPTSSGLASPASAGPSTAAAYKPADAKGKARNVPVPVMPELAKENSKAGLEAFIRYWYAQLSYVDETGDPSSWSSLISPDCQLCLTLQKAGRDAYTDGRWLVGGKITVPAVETNWTDQSVKTAKVQIVQDQIDYYNANGSTGRQRSEASNDAFAFFAKFAANGWIVVDLGVIA